MTVAAKLTLAGMMRRRLVLAWSSIGVALLAVVTVGVYIAFRTIESQNQEIDLLVRNLVTTTSERDALQRTSSELSERLSEATARVAALENEIKAAALERERLEEEAQLLRERLQTARQEIREALSETEAVRQAREREAKLADAALTYADAASALARTRDRMVDVLLQQIAAERAGRTVTARAMISEYNSLVSVHNRQVARSNAALASLRALLQSH